MTTMARSLAWTHPLVHDWFEERFGAPTEPEEQAWPLILAGRDVLISAPIGTGKTLTAFLTCIDRLVRQGLAGGLPSHVAVLSVSPLKALGNDIHQNLEIPLREFLDLAARRGVALPEVRASVQSGDALAPKYRAMLKQPPQILLTTPESLYIEPGRPWENGYCESFNCKLPDECFNGEIFYSLKEVQVVIDQWRVECKTCRPHSALVYRSPGTAAYSPLGAPKPFLQPEAVM